jgi:hypothetical protein
MGRGEKPALKTGERAGETCDGIANHRVPKLRVAFDVLVGVDEYFVDLRRKSLEDPLDERPATEELESFVHAAHAAASPSGQYDAGNRCAWLRCHGTVYLRKRCAPE